MNAIAPLPIEIDPRPCELCGLRVDRHQMVDDGEGPLFFCRDDLLVDELTLDELERRAELRHQEEVAATVARWEAADVPADIDRPAKKPEPYRAAQSTIDAFWHVVGLSDPLRFKAWLADHPKDAPFLLKILEGK